jgi:outer membrane murein-binding lipoprotein Lpp
MAYTNKADQAATTEGQLAAKILRIAKDRDCANQKIEAIAEIVAGPQ